MRRVSKRTTGVLSGAFLLATLLVGVTAGPASAATFTNSATITIPATGTSGVASPYPSTISVSGQPGVIADVNVGLIGISHSYGGDVDVLLVGPGGQDVVLMADRCTGNLPLTFLNFDDDVGSSLPASACASGGYRPTNGGSFDGPTPPGPYGSALSVFDGTNPNGTWSLYVYDDVLADVGSIGSGWTLNITLGPPRITSFSPTSGSPGTTVIIQGPNFTGATGVNFAGTSASFVLNSSTQITATVPSGAVTGPIGVTTPAGTGVSPTSFTVVPAPTITGFSPTTGMVGDAVVISGTTFTGASSVTFNGVAAAFVVNSPGQISASVPAGATTGPISVTTASGVGTSGTQFVVQHARNVSLHFSKATGAVTVLDGFAACKSGVPIKLQRFENGKWKTAASGVTRGSGGYNLGNPPEDGKYRVLAKATTTFSGDKCLKAASPSVHT